MADLSDPNSDAVADAADEMVSSGASSKSQAKADNLNYFLMNGYNSGNANTPIPVDVNFDAQQKTVFQEGPGETLPSKSTETPGNLATFGGRFGQQEEFNQLAQAGDRRDQDNSPIDDYVDPNWTATTDKTATIGIDPRNLGYILDATGPKDQRRRYNYVLDKQEQDEKLSNGNLFFQLAGGAAGFAASPSSLLPMAKMLKYAKLSTKFIQTLPKVVAGIAVSSAAHEAVVETSKVGGSLEDWAIDTFADTVLGSAFMGVGGAMSHSMEASKLYNASGVIKMMNQGIEARPILGEKGELTGWRATAMDSSVGAAQVDKAQAYLDGSMAKNSLYSIPYIGDKVGYAAGEAGSWIAGKVNPIIRNMNSTFTTNRGLIANVADHGFDTVGTEAGRENPDTHEHMMNVIRGTNKKLYYDYNGLFLQRNGINFDADKFGSRTAANVKGIPAEYFSKGEVTKEQFGREVQNSLINETPSQHSAVNEAAQMIRDAIDPVYEQYLKLNGYSGKILPPKTAKGYLMRVYHTAFMEVNEEKWMQVISNELRVDDTEISGLMEPINNAKDAVKAAQQAHGALARSRGITDEKVKASSDALDKLKAQKTRLEDDLQNQLRDNSDLHRHVDDINAVSANEAKQIKTILKPLKKIETELAKQKKIVEDIKKVSYRKEQATQKAKTAKTAKKQAALTDMSGNDLAIEEKKLREAQDKYDTEKQNLQDKMRDGTIDNSLFHPIPESNTYALKDPANRLKMRDTYESDFHRQNAAKAYYDSILNQTSEDNISNILGRMTNNAKENPLGKRTLMIRDQVLYDNNFLHPDPAINAMNYRLNLGRRNSIKTVLNRLTVNGDFESLIGRQAAEHSDMKAELSGDLHKVEDEIAKLKYLPTLDENQTKQLADLQKQAVKEKDKYDKKVKRLGRKFKAAKKDLELIIGKMEGKSPHSQKAREYSRIANTFAAAVKLMLVPISMSTDLMSTVFKHGLWPSVRDGLVPMLKTLGGNLNTKEGKDIREMAAHANLATDHMNTNYSDTKWTGTSQTYEPVQGRLVTGMETLAHYSSNFSGTNYIQTFLERWTASVVQSKIMKSMMDFKAGTLSDKDLKSLLRYGLNPAEHADPFIEQWKARGSDGNGVGGYQSRYWEWQDTNAATKMSSAIMRATRDTIIKRGMLDAPFAMDNPIIGSIFAFYGYTFASLTRYLAPLMQKPEADKLIGTMLMLAAGATQNPLRRMANGQPPLQDDDHMLRNAIRDGGVFSIMSSAFEDINFLTNSLLQQDSKNERYRNRTEMGVFNGPVGGIANDMVKIVGMAGRNEVNKQDLKRMAGLIPFLTSWQLRSSVNKWIDSTSYPKNRDQAHKLKMNS